MQQPKINELKPGDKFTVEFTLDKDGYLTAGSWRSALPNYLARQGSLSQTSGVVTSVTRAPRVPKAGDRYTRGDNPYYWTILFIDDKTVIIENKNGLRNISSRVSWDEDAYDKADKPRQWL